MPDVTRLSLVLAVSALAAGCADGSASQMPATCRIEQSLRERYAACRRARPEGLRAEDVSATPEELTMYRSGDPNVSRVCAFHVDTLRTDMAGEGCDTSLSADEAATLTAARAQRTAPLRAGSDEATRVLAEHARLRDVVCACGDAACVAAAEREHATLPLEALRSEPEVVQSNFDRIGAEWHLCATRPQILSPERWQRVR